MLLISLFLMVCSACLLIALANTSLEMVLSTMDWVLPYQ